MSCRRLPPVFCLLFSAFCILPSAFGQSATATLSGTVTDQNDAVVPGIAITVLNLSTALRRQAMTSEQGYFTVPLLPPGTYSVKAQGTGFTPIEIPNVVLNVGDQKALQIQLKAGDITEMVQVLSEAPLINESPAIATTVDRQFVGNLPLNGRSFQSLILLTPGVTVTTSSALTDVGQFSVNGQRASTNYFTVDGVGANIGITNTNLSSNNMALSGAYPGLSAFGGTNNLVSVDALEEFRIQTSSYAAEFGRQPGAQVSLVTRSGTNQFHGTAFEYFRNEALDARSYFNFKPALKPALRQNQFGGTFSGPLMLPRFGEGGKAYWSGRNHTFFFLSYEGQRLRLPNSGVRTVPSLRLRQIAAPALQPILNAFSLPTGPEFLNAAGQPTGFAPYNFSISNPSTLDATGIRIDHMIGGKLNLFGRFNEAPSETLRINAFSNRSFASTRTLTVGATWLLSERITNELRFNYSRQRAAQENQFTAIGGAVPIDAKLLTSGNSGQGSVGLSFGGSIVSFQGGPIVGNYQRQLNVVDNLSLVNGPHHLKFGIDFRRLSPTYDVEDTQSNQFFSEADVRNGTITGVTISTMQPARPQFDSYSTYAQDTWRASSRLTLDFGLRWELNPAPHEADGRMPPVAIGIVGSDVSQATLAPLGTQFYKTYHAAFAPRFGAAYSLNRTSGRERVLRGGFGVYYDLGSGTASIGWPFSASKSLSNVPFPVPVALATRPGIVLVTTLPTTSTVISLNQDLKLPYTLQWNIALEQSVGTQQSVSLSYVASAARRLLTAQSLNQRTGNSTGPRPNPNFATIRYSDNGPTSDYHSLQAQYRARFKTRFQALVNYTWSHAIDETSNDIQPGVLSRGNANFDVRHNLSAAATYKLPALAAGTVLTALSRGWSFDAIVHAQSGRPVDVIGSSTVIDNVLVSVRPDLVQGVPLYIADPTVPGGRRFNAAAFKAPPTNPAFPSVPARQGNFGRNVLRELPIYQVDVALGRTFALSESFKLQLKGEAFNVLNHPMFANYRNSITSPSTFGVPTSTLNVGLSGLSSLYQLGGPRSIQISLRLTF